MVSIIKVYENKTYEALRRSGKRYYAVTDKGVIYGSTPEIVQRKIERAGAGEKIYKPENRAVKNSNKELPF